MHKTCVRSSMLWVSQCVALLELINPPVYKTKKTILFLESASISRYQYKHLYNAGKLAVKTPMENCMLWFLLPLVKSMWICIGQGKRNIHYFFPLLQSMIGIICLQTEMITASNVQIPYCILPFFPFFTFSFLDNSNHEDLQIINIIPIDLASG